MTERLLEDLSKELRENHSTFDMASFQEGFEQAEKFFIEKACGWLKQDMLDNNAFQGRIERMAIIDGIIERFKQAMEAEDE